MYHGEPPGAHLDEQPNEKPHGAGRIRSDTTRRMCTTMNPEIDALDWMTNYAEGVVIEDTPTDSLLQLHGWFRERVEARAAVGRAARSPSLARQLAAVLTFDSWRSSPASALRGATLDDARHLVYVGREQAGAVGEDQSGVTANAVEVALSIYPANERRPRYVIIGQVLRADLDSPITVEVVDDDHVLAVATTAATGEFSIDVTESRSAIVLIGSDFELKVPLTTENVGEPR
jgi:hypothetical protein